MSHTYYSLMFHCVFATKNRRVLIPADLKQKLWPYMAGIARENKFKALAAGGTSDHAHVLLSLPTTIAVAKAVQLIKAARRSGSTIISRRGRSTGRTDTLPLRLAFRSVRIPSAKLTARKNVIVRSALRTSCCRCCNSTGSSLIVGGSKLPPCSSRPLRGLEFVLTPTRR